MSDGGEGAEDSRTSLLPRAAHVAAALAGSASRWLARVWTWLSADPMRVLGWVVVGVVPVVTAMWVWTDTIAPCAYGAFGPMCHADPVAPVSPISIAPTLIAQLDAGVYLQAGRVWALASIASGALAMVLAAARLSRWSIVLAAVPLLSAIVFGSLMMTSIVALASVAWILAPRDLVRSIAAGGLAIAVVWGLLPISTLFAGPGGPGRGGDLRSLLILTAAIVIGWVGISMIAASWRAAVRLREAWAVRKRAMQVEIRARERARLARDLHDVVAHHVSLVAVRAESAPYTRPDIDTAAREVLADIATDARAALGELRQVLGVLQRSEDAVELAPQPTGADVGILVADARAAGQVVEVRGDWGPVPAAAGYVLYRAAQEALTNARRHASAAPVTLRRDRRGDVLGLTVSNPVDRQADAGASGRGLVGMRERVESLGGSLEAQTTDGTFTLRVVIPVDSDS
ncbi:sensor histidine kinase [Occultella kanbiaonis]|uniref:sensor histidine kinase n=1 Tax=Occultella kanbiaonis TaxID=2675754 RepID=UPI0013D65A51|nr:histidine kinase [Occultella kanbiaonis]